MAQTFPLGTSFFGGLRVQTCVFDLSEAMASTALAGGQVLTHVTGPRLWGGTIGLFKHLNRDQAAVKAQIDVLRQPGRTFLAYPVDAPAPKNDPFGTILGVATPTLQTVNANNRDVTIQGLPSGYVLSVGDYVGWNNSNGVPVLHQIAVGGAANGSGVVTVEVSHPVRPGWVASASVRLINPYCKAVLVPESYQPGIAGRVFTSGPVFSFRQTLKA